MKRRSSFALFSDLRRHFYNDGVTKALAAVLNERNVIIDLGSHF
ncbi:MAG: hypothetical protein ABIU09_12910 [Pyrinomonadaceae bacterium]